MIKLGGKISHGDISYTIFISVYELLARRGVLEVAVSNMLSDNWHLIEHETNNCLRNVK